MASRGVNRVTLVGNLGQDPEVRYMPNGNAVANLTLATSESYKDKNTGQNVDKTEWHRIVVFGKLADIAGEYLRKGSQVYFEGKLATRKWTDQQGVEKYTTEIVVDAFDGKMQILGSKSEGQNQGQQNAPQQQNNQNQGYAPQQQNNAPQQGGGYQQPQNQGYAPQQNAQQNNHGQQYSQGQQGAPQQQGGFAPKRQ